MSPCGANTKHLGKSLQVWEKAEPLLPKLFRNVGASSRELAVGGGCAAGCTRLRVAVGCCQENPNSGTYVLNNCCCTVSAVHLSRCPVAWETTINRSLASASGFLSFFFSILTWQDWPSFFPQFPEVLGPPTLQMLHRQKVTLEEEFLHAGLSYDTTSAHSM